MKESRRTHRFLICLPIALLVGCSAAPPDEEAEIDGPEPTGDREDAVGAGTVSEAVSSSCSTSSVKGLSMQIIEEAACIEPGAFVELADLPNLVVNGGAVYVFLEAPAKAKLEAALKANPGKDLLVNSMLRTVAQQYLLRRWGEKKTCGIKVAATPGNSNHETGLALDVQNYSSWKSTLSSHGFKWFGSSDPPHFDYVGAGAESHKGLDVRAFQRLWNRNHPEDKIAVDGDYGPQTEARLKKSPAQGFALGAICSGDSEPFADTDEAAGEDDAMPADDVAQLDEVAQPKGDEVEAARLVVEGELDGEAVEHECEGHQ